MMTGERNQLTDDDFTVTDPAREKVTALLNDADDEVVGVRIFVSGGGCSGMNYGMTFAHEEAELDAVLDDQKGCKLFIDPVALNFLRGAEIDYVDDEMNATFMFNNVFQAIGGSGSCSGCGSAQ